MRALGGGERAGRTRGRVAWHWRAGTAHARACEQNATEAGRDSAPPVLLLAHAAGLTKECWSPFVDTLLAAGAPVAGYLSLDFGGHGGSDGADHADGHFGSLCPANIREVLRDAGLLGEGDDAESVVPIVGVGHSMGGTGCAIAEMDAARRADGAPNTDARAQERTRARAGDGVGGLFTRLVLLEPVLFDAEAAAAPWSRCADRNLLYATTRARQRRWGNREELLAYLVAKGRPYAAWDARAVEAYADSATKLATRGGRDLELRCSPEVEAPFYLHPPIVVERLREIVCPVALLVGSASRHFDLLKRIPTVQYYERHCISRMRDATLHVVDGVGHFLPQEAPERIAAHVCRALGFDEAAAACAVAAMRARM